MQKGNDNDDIVKVEGIGGGGGGGLRPPPPPPPPPPSAPLKMKPSHENENHLWNEKEKHLLS